MKRTIWSFLVSLLMVGILLVPACAPAAQEPAKPVSGAAPEKKSAPAASSEAAKPATTGAPEAAKEPYKVGMILSMTGTYGGPGGAMARAIELEVERINARGGVDGHPIKLISYDDRSKVEETVALLKKAAMEDKVAAILGPVMTPIINGSLPTIRELKVPTFAIGSFTPAKEDPYVFTNVNSLEDLMTLYFEFFKKKGWKKIAGLHPTDDLSNRAAKLIETMAPKYGFEVIAQERMAQTDTDVTPQLTKIRPQNPDVLITWGSGDAAVLVYKNARQLGITAPIFYNTSASGSHWFKLTGEIPQAGMVYVGGAKLQTIDVLPDSDPMKKEAAEFRQAFQAKHGLMPEYNEAVMWDMVHQVADALKASGPDREKIKQYLETNKFCGVGFCYSKTADNHVGLDISSMRVMTAKGNAWILAQ